MTQYERMKKGLIYDTCDEEIQKIQQVYKNKLWEFNQLSPSQSKKKSKYLKEVFAECGEHCFIESPFHASWGGHHVHFGNRIYANFNLTLIDDGHIYVGDRVLFAPNVTVLTANHTLEPELRRYEMQYVRDVHIGENTWICTGVIILPGVKIGKNCVIGAGSVVTRDIPDDSLAFGNPCKVMRKIGESDREIYFHGDHIDWENLQDHIEKKRNDWSK